jgi:hypothetical protein
MHAPRPRQLAPGSLFSSDNFFIRPSPSRCICFTRFKIYSFFSIVIIHFLPFRVTTLRLLPGLIVRALPQHKLATPCCFLE